MVYLITPFLVPYLWWRNRSRDNRALEERDLIISSVARTALRVVGVIGLVFCLASFVWPTLLISITPWRLTELTSRIFAGWGVLAFATMDSVARDGRWSAIRILLQSFMVGQVPTLLAIPRIWIDLDPANPMTYVFVGGLALSLVVCVVIYVGVERKTG